MGVGRGRRGPSPRIQVGSLNPPYHARCRDLAPARVRAHPRHSLQLHEPGVPSATHQAAPPPPGPPRLTPGARAAAPRSAGAGVWPACAATWREDPRSPRVLTRGLLHATKSGSSETTAAPWPERACSRSAEPGDLSRALTADWPGAKASGSRGSSVRRPAARINPELVRNAGSRASPQPRCSGICILTSSPGDSLAH